MQQFCLLQLRMASLCNRYANCRSLVLTKAVREELGFLLRVLLYVLSQNNIIHVLAVGLLIILRKS